MATIRIMKVEAIKWRGRGYYWGTTTFKTFIDDKGNETYYVNEKEVSAEEGNEYYLNIKRGNREYQKTEDCKEYIKRQWAGFYKSKRMGGDGTGYCLHEKDTFKQTVEEYETTYEEMIEKLRKSYDEYVQYIDDYRQYSQAVDHNEEIMKKIKKLEQLIAER